MTIQSLNTPFGKNYRCEYEGEPSIYLNGIQEKNESGGKVKNNQYKFM